MAQPRDDDLCGVWQAWVEGGKSYDERRARFDAVPTRYRAAVRSHMRTVTALERFHERRNARRRRWA